MTQKVSSASIEGLETSKLTGAAMPAIDGSALTNLNSGILKSTTNPAIDSNPSGGVGTLWVNKTTGQIYNCTDATAGSNVWKNIGSGTGGVEPFTFQGLTHGYVAGGVTPAPNYWSNTIDRVEFASASGATDVGDLSISRSQINAAGTSSATAGYSTGGSITGWAVTQNIEKFDFASSSNGASHGSISCTQPYGQHGSSDGTYGFISGGWGPADGLSTIEKFAFAGSSVSAVGHGNLAGNHYRGASNTDSSAKYGYCSGGYDSTDPWNANRSIIQKFSFISDSDASVRDDLSTARFGAAGLSSTTHGYAAGGGTGSNSDIVDKFAFANGNTAVQVNSLSLTVARHEPSSSSSTTEGWILGGDSQKNTIDKFNFSTEVDTYDNGDLTVGRAGGSGHQV